MSKSTNRTETRTAVVKAPASVAFEIVTDLRHWPQFFPDGVYAEEDGDVVRWWALEGDGVRHWASRRTLDRGGLSVTYDQVDCQAPLTSASIQWRFRPAADGTCEAELTLRADGQNSNAGRDAVAAHLKGADELIKQVAAIAQNWDQLKDLVVHFEDPLFIAGNTEAVYGFLYDADKWPERVPHVTALTMTEDQPGVQFFDMDTVTPEGRAHTTRSVRICLPHKIIYKQIGLPKLLDAHTGHWHFHTTPEGVTVTARHTATIRPDALNLLGENTTVADARRYLRRVLSTNSLQTLRHAQAFAEEPAHA